MTNLCSVCVSWVIICVLQQRVISFNKTAEILSINHLKQPELPILYRKLRTISADVSHVCVCGPFCLSSWTLYISCSITWETRPAILLEITFQIHVSPPTSFINPDVLEHRGCHRSHRVGALICVTGILRRTCLVLDYDGYIGRAVSDFIVKSYSLFCFPWPCDLWPLFCTHVYFQVKNLCAFILKTLTPCLLYHNIQWKDQGPFQGHHCVT